MIVFPIEQSDVDLRVEFFEPAHLPVFARYQTLSEGREFDVLVDLRQVKIWPESLGYVVPRIGAILRVLPGPDGLVG